jgi:hypothetical protein
MKTARYLLTIVGAGALTLGVGYAGEPSAKAAHEDHTASDRPAELMDGHAQERPKQVVKSHEVSGKKLGETIRTKHTSVNEPSQPALNRTAPIANHELTMNKIETRHEDVPKAPMGGGTAALAPGVVHERSATTAGVGGLRASSAKTSAAVLNGTTINRSRY